MKRVIILLLTTLLAMNGWAQNFSQLMKGYEAYNRFSGSVLVEKNHKILFNYHCGLASVTNQHPNHDTSLYNLASVSKTITAAAIFRLHDQGKLSVYDRVDKYLPGFIDDSTANIRIINLLNHTSGMAANICQSDEQGNGLVLPTRDPISCDSMLLKFKNTRLKFKPGSQFEYNNYGYILLAYVIEKVSGIDYATYIQHEISQPAGMNHTFFKTNIQGAISEGYAGIGTKVRKSVTDQEYHPSWIVGASGIYSTANDLSKFMDAVFNDQLFSAKTRQLMLDSCISSSFHGVQWTLGWSKHTFAKEPYYAHSGSDNGYSTKIIYLPSQQVKVVILSNLVRDLADESLKGAKFSFVDEISENILKLLFKQEVTCLPTPKPLNNQAMAGTYKLDATHKMTLKAIGDTLRLSIDSLSLFEYAINSPVNDTSTYVSRCNLFTQNLRKGSFDGFEVYVNAELKKQLFNKNSISQLTGGWSHITKQSGNYLSSTIYKKVDEPNNHSYYVAHHFEKSEVLMVLSFSNDGLMQGLFILNILPKCTVKQVCLTKVGSNSYFIDGYRHGGYPDYTVTYNRKSKLLNFISANENFSALKE